MQSNILLETPYIRTIDNILSPDECKNIIDNLESLNFSKGAIVNTYGIDVIDDEFRSAETAVLPENLIFLDSILDRISVVTGYDKNRFEIPTILKYGPGQYFKNHQDFFIHHNSEEHLTRTRNRCRRGGNRVSTIIIYLNDDFKGGETYFPWDRIIVKPKQGSMLQFDYGYEDVDANLRSQHVGMNVEEGVKFILTIWIREQSRQTEVTNYKKFDGEQAVYQSLENVQYQLSVGPEEDKRDLTLNLPANDDPMASIIVGYTGGMDSSLLLYLLGMLNNLQKIPYHIRPVCITSKFNQWDTSRINEDFDAASRLVEHIRTLGVKNVRPLIFRNTPINAKPKFHVRLGLLTVFREKVDKLRFWNPKHIFTAEIQQPDDGDPRWQNIGHTLVKSNSDRWVQPFWNLQKPHVIDAIIQLGLEDILKMTPKCGIEHKSLSDNCPYFPCNERRWGFVKLNKISMGEQYFLQHTKGS